MSFILLWKCLSRCLPNRYVAGVLLLIVLKWILTFLVVFPVLLSDTTFSMYHKPWPNNTELIRIVVDQNQRRYTDAEEYFKSVTLSTDVNLALDKALIQARESEVAFVIVTTRRQYKGKDTGFLTQTAAALHRQVNRRQSGLQHSLVLCNVHLTGNFTELEALPKLIPVVSLQDRAEAGHTGYEKEKKDYVSCINSTLAMSPLAKHIIVVEDDILPDDRALETIDYITQHYYYDYVKLFYPLRWQGFGHEYRPMADLVTVGVISGLFWGYVYARVLRRLHRGVVRTKWMQLVLLTLLGGAYGITASLLIGRQTLMDALRMLGPYCFRLVPAYGASTAMTMYNAHTARQMLPYLANVTCSKKFPVDVAINTYRNQNNLLAYSIEPNIVKHIGFASSFKGIKRILLDFI